MGSDPHRSYLPFHSNGFSVRLVGVKSVRELGLSQLSPGGEVEILDDYGYNVPPDPRDVILRCLGLLRRKQG